MHWLRGSTTLRWLVLGIWAQGALGAVVPTPTITAAPIVGRQDPNAIELAKVLLTALPASLREIAATNIPAVSSILWREFLDDNKPNWFTALPSNIQSYLIVEYGPSTAWPTSTPTPSSSIPTTSADLSITAESSAETSAPNASATSDPDSPLASNSGLSQGAKIGLGVGVSLGVLALLAAVILCCIARRKKRSKKTSGYEPPPSPGFMPHGAFHEKSTSYQEHRSPLNRNQSWDQDDEQWMQPVADDSPYSPQHRVADAPLGNSNTIAGPPLVHTHSSSRARGKRTSHNSLHSVAEVTEPDDDLALRSSRSQPSMSLQAVPPVPAGASIRRKPVSMAAPPPADRGSYGHFSLLRPAVLRQDHSGSSSSGLAPTVSSPEDSRRSSANTPPSDVDEPSPPLSSPTGENPARASNPFTNANAYVEDYGPEYQPRNDRGNRYDSGYAQDFDAGNSPVDKNPYVDVHDGLYGGHRRLDAYPVVPAKSERRSSKGAGPTEWPLREWPLMSLGNVGRGRRESSPRWDRVYE